LAQNADARQRRREVLAVPRSLSGLGACFTAAERLVAAAEAEADASLAGVDEEETAALEQALGAGGTGRGVTKAMRGSAGALKDLADQHKARRTRARRDALDRALVDLAAFYRDVLVRTIGAPVDPVHPDASDVAAAAAAKWTPESALRRVEAVLACREAVAANVKPRIAVEDLTLALWKG